MRLYITDPSPYARKCRIVLRERGLIGACEERRADPYADDPDLVDANPIVQVPALVTNTGEVFTDSPLICAWLDAQGTSGPRLLPPEGPDHWRTNLGRTLNALEARDIRPEPLDLGVVATGVLVTWLGFRHPEFDWREGRPKLAALSEALEARPSFAETFPR